MAATCLWVFGQSGFKSQFYPAHNLLPSSISPKSCTCPATAGLFIFICILGPAFVRASGLPRGGAVLRWLRGAGAPGAARPSLLASSPRLSDTSATTCSAGSAGLAITWRLNSRSANSPSTSSGLFSAAKSPLRCCVRAASASRAGRRRSAATPSPGRPWPGRRPARCPALSIVSGCRARLQSAPLARLACPLCRGRELSLGGHRR